MHEKSKLYGNEYNPELQQLEEELYETKEEQISNNINLEIIRKPFVRKRSSSAQRSPKQAHVMSPYVPQRQSSPSQFASVSLPGEGLIGIANTHTFTWIFELSVLLLVISLPCTFYFPSYMNVLYLVNFQIVLLLLITLNMISGYFCRYILRVWMGLVMCSILVDIVWYLVGAKAYWIGTNSYPS